MTYEPGNAKAWSGTNGDANGDGQAWSSGCGKFEGVIDLVWK